MAECAPGVIHPYHWLIHVLGIVFFKRLSSETARPIFTRFHMGPSVEDILTIYLNGYTPLNKMVAMSILGKNTINNSSSPKPRNI